MYVINAEFIISVSNANKLPNYHMPEIAVVGKSNVGKSSFINFITDYKNLARTSQEPGRTRLINYFLINKKFYLVDLPGNGYARVSDAEKKKSADLTDKYFESENLRHVFVLFDIRHEPTQNDIQMIDYLFRKNIDFSIIATKADKLSTMRQNIARKRIAESLNVGINNVYVVSSIKKTGRDAVEFRIKQILE